MSGLTRNFDAIEETIALIAAEMGSDGLYPNWANEIRAYTLFIDCVAPDKPDAPTVWVAAWCFLGLTRTAADSASLKLLRDWLSDKFNGHDTLTMIHRTKDWSSANAADRLCMVDVIEALALDVERDVAGCVEEDDLAIELAEIRQELADLRQHRMQPTLTTLSWLTQSRPVRALAKAVRAFRRNYPMRAMDPIDTLDKVAEARASIARRLP